MLGTVYLTKCVKLTGALPVKICSRGIDLRNVSAEIRQNYILRQKRKLIRLMKKPKQKIKIPDFNPLLMWKHESRVREKVELSPEDKMSRLQLEKRWNKHVLKLNQERDFKMERLIACQSKALRELFDLSPNMFKAAVKVDTRLLPVTCRGPVQALPYADYLAPLGALHDQNPAGNIDETEA